MESRRKSDWFVWVFRLLITLFIGLIIFLGKDMKTKTEANTVEINLLKQTKAEATTLSTMQADINNIQLMLVAHDQRLSRFLITGGKK